MSASGLFATRTSLPWQQLRVGQWKSNIAMELAIAENPWQPLQCWPHFLYTPSYGEFCVKITKFSLPWQQGTV